MHLVGIGYRGNGSTRRLKDQRYHVAKDKDDGVSSRATSRNLFAIDDHNPPETDVNRGAEECRGNGKAD